MSKVSIIVSVYNEENQTGLFRHIVVKVGKYTNEVMCILVINGKNFPKEEKLVELLCNKYKNIRTIVKNINDKNTNVILGRENINLYGDGYIEDKLGDYTFKISPLSFYQINPVQAEKLYNIAIESANLNKEDILFDLYCGIGTIGIFASKYVKKVYGSLTKFGVRWWRGVACFFFLGVGRLLGKRQNSFWVSGKAPFRGLGVTPLGKRVRPFLGKRVRPLLGKRVRPL